MGKITSFDCPKNNNLRKIESLYPGEIFKVQESEDFFSIYMVIFDSNAEYRYNHTQIIDLASGKLIWIKSDLPVISYSANVSLTRD